MRRWILSAVAVGALGGALSACETATPYQPLQQGVQAGGGYVETRIEDDRWRVTFKGNDETARGVVETYMLYRAAELTLAQGDDWFEAAQRHTDTHTSGYGAGWGQGWGFGYRRWGPWGGTFWDQDIAFDTEQRYEASVEIVLHHGSKPADDPHAFDARQVVANLGPKIVRPGQTP
jgi:hypothetical protein